MGKREYSAGIVSKGFWFLEFKKFLGLLREGKSEIEIRKLQEEKNIFSASSKDYGKRIVGEIMKRTRAISDEIKELFFKVDVGTQKVINLLSVMQTDKLFFEYVYNSYRNDMLLGTQEYNSNAVKKFLEKAEKGMEVQDYEFILKEITIQETSPYESRLNLLASVISISPMLGLLGTVTGMIRAFTNISKYGAGDAAIVADGIAEALLTTAAGLMIAIPVIVVYNYLNRRLEKMENEIDDVVTNIINIFRR